MLNERRAPTAILLGSKPGAVVALEIMLRRGWNVLAVSPADSPATGWLPRPMLEDAARAANVSVISQRDVAVQAPVDFVISYMYRYRVRAETRALARRAAVNFHAAPLPEFGGWAFYNVAILEQRSVYGCTCHWMVEAFDAGPILATREFAIDARTETALSLERRAQEEMVRLFDEFCDLAEKGIALPAIEQEVTRQRYMTREQFEALKEVPAGADEETMDRWGRAFWHPPHHGAYITHNGLRCELIPATAREGIARAVHEADLDRLRRAASCRKRDPDAGLQGSDWHV